ncbi:AtaL-like protein [Aquabacterium sp. A3]|uniref:AtaL-like protein n=1 Tax=Aquabacterium sp. A3 TaxID=3132829 RepID=UPI0031195B22
MRFEHLIEINAPQPAADWLAPTFTRDQLWQGLMLKVLTPQRFPLGPQGCDCTETAPGVYARVLRFGPHTLQDEVRAQALQRLVFTPQAHGDTTPIRLTITVEEPHAGRMVLRFVYEALGEQSAEEAYFNGYRHSAWVEADRDMVRTLREWLGQGELGGVSLN